MNVELTLEESKLTRMLSGEELEQLNEIIKTPDDGDKK